MESGRLAKGGQNPHFFLDSALIGVMLYAQRMSVTGSYSPVADGVDYHGIAKRTSLMNAAPSQIRLKHSPQRGHALSQ